RILEENRDKVEAMTAALMEFETLDADQIDDVMAGRSPRPPKVSSRDASSSSSGGDGAVAEENPDATPSANPA
ncbi:MAG: cell division protein FtsH, partial [Burkholderiales bacterium]|nr:cell division protein FtsH [Burkholderiales bacterium]